MIAKMNERYLRLGIYQGRQLSKPQEGRPGNMTGGGLKMNRGNVYWTGCNNPKPKWRYQYASEAMSMKERKLGSFLRELQKSRRSAQSGRVITCAARGDRGSIAIGCTTLSFFKTIRKGGWVPADATVEWRTKTIQSCMGHNKRRN